MTTTMKHKRSSVAGNAPDAADIETGELAINFPDAALYTKDGSGNIIELSITDSIKEPVKNVSGGSLSVGTVVYQSGTAGNSAEVQAASNSSASTMPALGILTSTLADEAEGYVVLIGKINGVNTSSFSEGDTLYVGASGTLTTTVPSGEGALIQNIGKVLKVHASNGSIMVTGAGRTNATPNLNDGNIFIGNSSNQATTASFNTTVDTHLNRSTASANDLLRWNGSDYEWYSSSSTMSTYKYTATSGQTTFSGLDDSSNTLAYTANNIIVTVNGITFEDGTDYTATNGTSIVFTSGLTTDDEVNIIAFTVTSLIDLATVDFSDVTNKPTTVAGYGITDALTEVVDDTTPQLGGDLDTNGSDITFGDNDKAIFGAGSDLQIYHDGSHSYITDVGTGSLYIRGQQNIEFQNGSGGKTYARFVANGTAKLFYDNSEKLATTSTGIDITGNATFDDNGKAIFGAGNDLEILHDGTNSVIRDNGAGNLSLTTNGSKIGFYDQANNQFLAEAFTGAGFRLYYDGSQKFVTQPNGIDVTGTVTADGLTVGEYKVNTTETSTSATTETAIKSISATDFRSARFTVQVTNTTDSTYHLTEVLVIHDGTTPSITEYGTVFTGAAAEATFDADISSNNLRLLATPASADSMTFKVVAHAITS